MRPEVKKMWVDALRSGDYPQSYDVMHSPYGYCCLGVLADLYCKDTGTDFESFVNECDNQAPIGIEFFNWVGEAPTGDNCVNHAYNKNAETMLYNPLVDAALPYGTTGRISELNDSMEYTFSQIADVIEECL